MQTTYLAHILPNNPSIVQTCREHLRNTAKYAAHSLKSVNLYSSAYLAGLIHDLGKCKESYQEYLLAAVSGENVRRGSVIHTFTGTRYLLQYHNQNPTADLTYKDMISEILAYAVGAHHGLFDCINEDHENGFLHRLQTIPDGDEEAVCSFLAECADEKELNDLFEKATSELTPVLEKCGDIARDDSDDEWLFLCGLVVRLLTSAVMEGDRRDTAEFMNGAVFPAEADQNLWHNLLLKTETKLGLLSSDTPINQARQKISDMCRNASEKIPGIYRLTEKELY